MRTICDQVNSTIDNLRLSIDTLRWFKWEKEISIWRRTTKQKLKVKRKKPTICRQFSNYTLQRYCNLNSMDKQFESLHLYNLNRYGNKGLQASKLRSRFEQAAGYFFNQAVIFPTKSSDAVSKFSLTPSKFLACSCLLEFTRPLHYLLLKLLAIQHILRFAHLLKHCYWGLYFEPKSENSSEIQNLSRNWVQYVSKTW